MKLIYRYDPLGVKQHADAQKALRRKHRSEQLASIWACINTWLLATLIAVCSVAVLFVFIEGIFSIANQIAQ